MSEAKSLNLAITLTEDGSVKIDTNLAPLFAIRLLASAQDVIVQKQIEDTYNEVEDKEQEEE